MKVLVTGGTGYLGRAIVRALEGSGHEPVTFARRASNAGLPGSAIDGDVRDRAAVERAVTGVDAVCHSAALVSLWRPRREDFDDVNVRGLENVLDACASKGVRRIVYTSSFLALPPAGRTSPIAANDYQRTKVRGREVALAAAGRGLPIVLLYPGVVYGPGLETEGNLVGRLVRDHLEGRLPGIVGASRVWSYAYVDDVASAHVRALEIGSAAEEIVLGGENAQQIRVFEIVRELTGHPLPRRIPHPVAAMFGLLEEVRASVTGRPPAITRGAATIFRYDWPLESDSASRLDYRSRPLTTGLREILPKGV